MRSIYKCVICGSYTEDTVHCGGVQARLLLDGKLRSRLSHLMTYLLRHDPDAADLSMDSEGWVSIDELVHALRNKWDPKAYSWLTKEHIMAVASLDPKVGLRLGMDD